MTVNVRQRTNLQGNEFQGYDGRLNETQVTCILVELNGKAEPNGMSVDLAALNAGSESLFVQHCGSFFEHSLWIAQRAFASAPFADRRALHCALLAVMYSASDKEQLGLINAHPELVGRLTEQPLTAESTGEQRAAGLDALSPTERVAFERYNAEYRRRFAFPFILCARQNKKDAILTAFPLRLANDRDAEIQTALAEIGKIAWFRLIYSVVDGSSHR